MRERVRQLNGSLKSNPAEDQRLELEASPLETYLDDPASA